MFLRCVVSLLALVLNIFTIICAVSAINKEGTLVPGLYLLIVLGVLNISCNLIVLLEVM